VVSSLQSLQSKRSKYRLEDRSGRLAWRETLTYSVLNVVMEISGTD